jgi:hypothetical protein
MGHQKKKPMSNKNRRDPYKIFNFRVAIGAALVGVAALVIARKASSVRPDTKASRRNAFWRLFGMDLK